MPLLLLAALLVPAAPGCGKKGAPQAPLRTLPEPVTGLRVRQVGEQVVLSLERPSSHTNGTPLAPDAALEILMTAREPVPRTAAEVLASPAVRWTVPISQWDDYARERRMEVGLRLSSIASALELPEGAAALKGRKLSFVVGVVEQERLRSPSAKVITLKVCEPPPPPAGVSARPDEAGIIVTWDLPAGTGTPGAGYHVYRQPVGAGALAGAALTTEPLRDPPFLDTGYVPGQAFRYVVRAAAAGDPTCESAGVSSEQVTWVDRFAPAAPEGLAAVEEDGAVRLFWRPNREPDLLGYRVYRGEGPDGPLTPLTTEPIQGTTWTDTSAVRGIVYSYAVGALDRANNESPLSERATGQVEADSR
ncbi:MAG: fibronectin type III domain-containing protein [Candidatus Polarisedimenticolia bacterium]